MWQNSAEGGVSISRKENTLASSKSLIEFRGPLGRGHQEKLWGQTVILESSIGESSKIANEPRDQEEGHVGEVGPLGTNEHPRVRRTRGGPPMEANPGSQTKRIRREPSGNTLIISVPTAKTEFQCIYCNGA